MGLDINKTDYLEALTATVSLFDNSHTGLLRGVGFLGVVQISKMCTLSQMMSVSECWTQLSIMLRGILDSDWLGILDDSVTEAA